MCRVKVCAHFTGVNANSAHDEGNYLVSRAHILVVDDDVNMLRMLALTLFVEGFLVATADCGQDAKRLIQETAFDVLIVDLRMPGVDCFDIIDVYRQRCKAHPVIVTTKYPDDVNTQRCLSAQASVLQKPYNVHSLATRLRETLRVQNDRV